MSLDTTVLKEKNEQLDVSKINFLIIDNPLKPESIIIETRDVEDGAYLSEYLGDLDENWLITYNGDHILMSDAALIVPSENDIVTVTPIPRGDNFKALLSIVLIVALSVVTYGAAGTGFGGIAGAIGGWTGFVVATAVFIGGVMIINALLPMTPDEPEGFERSQTYGIDGPKNTSRGGIPVPVVIGPYKMGGNFISIHNTNGEDTLDGYNPVQSNWDIDPSLYEQYPFLYSLYNGYGYNQTSGTGYSHNTGEQFLYMLINAGEGPIAGISGIELNDQDIGNFAESEWTLRDGNDTQEPIRAFQNAIVARNVSLTHDSVGYSSVRSTVSPCEQLRVDVVFPQGFYRQRSDGDRDAITLHLNIEYSVAGANQWKNFADGTNATGTTGEAYKIQKRSVDPLRMSFYSKVLPSGQYDVRIKRDNAPAARIISNMIWVDLNEINTESVRLIHTALLGVKVRVDDQLSAIPKVTFTHRGIKLSNYNESTGGWQVTQTNNPAWVVWNILTNTRWGAGLPTSGLDEYAFREWAIHCEDEGYQWVGIIDQSMSAWDAIKPMLRVGHAQLVRVGNKYSVNIEKAKEPSQLFNNTNIKEGSFSQTWYPLEGRANQVEVTYFDKDDGYRPKMAKVVDQDVQNKVLKPVTTKITLYGVDNLDQAQKEAQFELNVNSAITNEVSFEVPMEAIACSVGDVVSVQHDQPEWGDGGRTEAGSTTTSIVLDREVEKLPGTYQMLLVYDSLTRYTNTISAKNGNVLTITGLDWSTFQGNPDKLTKTGAEVSIVRKVTNAGDDGIEVTDASAFAIGNTVNIVDTDAIVVRSVTSADGTHSTITTSAFPAAPTKGTKWAYGPINQNVVDYTLREINQTSDFDARLTCIEYNENVFNVVVGTTVDPYSYDTTPLGPVTFEADPWDIDLVPGALNTRLYNVTISWTHSSWRYQDAEVLVSITGHMWRSKGYHKNSYTIENVSEGANISVLVVPRSVEGVRSSNGAQTEQTLLVVDPGLLEPPADPINFSYGIVKYNAIQLTWGDGTNDPSVMYEIAVKNDTAGDDGATKIVENADRFFYVTDVDSHMVTGLDPLIEYTFWIRAVRLIDPSIVSAWVGGTNGLSVSTLTDKTLYYIKTTNGIAIQNGVGTLTLEARIIDGGVDSLLDSGTIKLYVGSTEVTVANGYAAGSDGYTGVFDAGDINGDVTVHLKDGPTGTVLDAQKLLDVTDGDDAVYYALSNQNITIPAANDGTGYTLPSPGGTFHFYKGTTDLTGDPSVSYSVVGSATKNGLTIDIASTGIYTLSGASWTSDIESFTLRATYNTVSYDQEFTISKAKAGADGDPAEFYYIKPTNGTAIKNSSGTLTIEAHKVTGTGDVLLSSGTIKLYVGTTEVTVANGYATGSDGYTGVFDAGDINGDVVVELKDGPAGTVLDTITLADITDGDSAVVGFITPSNGLAWTRAVNGGNWTPAQLYTDLVCEFWQGGSQIATETRRVTINASNGTFTHALQGVDDAGIAVTTSASGETTLTVTFEHTASNTVVAETVLSAESGFDGDPAVQYYIKPTAGTAIKNSSGQLTVEARKLDGSTDTLLNSGTIRLYDPSNNIVNVTNGYVTGSDGYTGILNAGDINGSKVITLKDGVGGTPLDTITLVDITDGDHGVVGSIEASNGLAWTRAVNAGAWTPSQAWTDLVCKFYENGSQIATETWRVTLNTGTGNLSAALQSANDGNITVSTINNNTSAVTLNFEHTPSGTIVGETVLSSMSGSDGDPGLSVAEIYCYKRSASAPATPTGGSYSFTTNTLTAPAGWSNSIPSGTDPLYISATTASIVGDTGVDNTLTWSSPVIGFQNGEQGPDGPDGQSVDVVFKRSATQPGTPSPSTGTPTGWYSSVDNVPGGSDPIWASVGTRPDSTSNYTWQVPVQLEGDPGLSIAELSIYRRSASAPSTPTGGSYNFDTKVISPPTNWFVNPPSGTDPCYISRGVAAIEGQSGTDNSITWSGPVKIFEDGSDGEAVDIVFQRSATQPDTPSPSSGVPSGWYSNVNSVPASANPMWSSVGTRPNSGSNWTWQVPVKIEGQDGENGVLGIPLGGTLFNGGFGIPTDAISPTRPAGWFAEYTTDGTLFDYRDTAQTIARINSSADSSYGIVSSAFRVIPGKTYKVSVNARALGTNRTLSVRINRILSTGTSGGNLSPSKYAIRGPNSGDVPANGYDNTYTMNDDVTYQSAGVHELTTNFATYSGTWTCPADHTWVSVSLTALDANSGDYEFANVSVEEQESDTENLSTNAATIAVQDNQSSYSVSTGSNGSYQTIESTTITTPGGYDIRLVFSFMAYRTGGDNPYFYMQFRRGTSSLGIHTIRHIDVSTFRYPNTFVIVDTPSAGTYTYDMRIQTSQSTQSYVLYEPTVEATIYKR